MDTNLFPTNLCRVSGVEYSVIMNGFIPVKRFDCICSHTLCMLAAMALASLRICSDSPVPIRTHGLGYIEARVQCLVCFFKHVGEEKKCKFIAYLQ